jgi:hypothetical protein
MQALLRRLTSTQRHAVHDTAHVHVSHHRPHAHISEAVRSACPYLVWVVLPPTPLRPS